MKYEIKLAAYSGPLDLLLALISKAKIEIKDIFISEITEQYLEYISAEGNIDMDSASDFVQMAAQLLYIKSRALLPRITDDELDEDGLTPEESLIKRLNIYKSFVQLSEKMKALEHEGAKRYFKLPDELADIGQEEIYLNADVRLLPAYMHRLLNKKPVEKPTLSGVTFVKDTFSIREQIKLITARLAIQPEMTFRELMTDSPSREEIAVTFISLLELVSKNKVKISQDRIFGDIFITRYDEKKEAQN